MSAFDPSQPVAFRSGENMNQKLSDWASIAEIASGFAVVLTLIFLVHGINKNTEVTQATMYADIVSGLNGINLSVVSDPELRRLWLNYARGTTSDLTEEEIQALSPIIFSRAAFLDSALSMWRSDLIGPSEWERMEVTICREYERNERIGIQQLIFGSVTQDYRRFVETTC
jgi:hypothetical protein